MMTNLEYYKDNLKEILNKKPNSIGLDVQTLEPAACDNFEYCTGCIFKTNYYGDCSVALLRWLFEEKVK